jgi:3-isopropylmalate/(R)-2-methylmalate dehydratase small subunit/methanogen homoaconitase small subunit
MHEAPARYGRTWVFGDDLNTDVLHPPQFYSLDDATVRRGLFFGIDPAMQASIEQGDVIVGGRNFGCGSSRETCVRSMKLNGIAAVVAVDFARIFFRSATNQGLPCLTLKNPAALGTLRRDGRGRVDLDDVALVLDDGERIALDPPNDFVRRIWAAGGLLGLLP